MTRPAITGEALIGPEVALDAEQGASARCDLLIRNAYVLTMDAERRIFPSGAIAIDNGAVTRVGPEREIQPRVEPLKVIDAHGAPVHPGFVEGHVHLMPHLQRFLFLEQQETGDYLELSTLWWNALDDEEEYAGSLLSCLELLLNGTTCFVEAGTMFEPETAARAAERLGLRAVLADPWIWDVATLPPLKRAPVDRKRATRLLGGQLWRNRDEDALVRGHIALWGIGSASEDLEIAAKECADSGGVFLSQHQSWRPDDSHFDDERFGRHPLVHFSEIGLLSPNCTFHHMNHIRDDEVAPVVESGMSITWCPAAQMIWGTGATMTGRHLDFLRSGVNVALGSDSANSCVRFDTGFQALLASLMAREQKRSPQALTSEEALEMAILGGARAAGLSDRIGSIVPGKRADIVIRRNDLPEMHPGFDVPQTLVFSAGGKSVRTVLIDGQIVVEDGYSTRIDHEHVYALVREAAQRMLNRTGYRFRPRWPSID
jgi:cytosine/adenosine deaminase-related metal-dependent hydrolase